jgi:hypothetical protein
VKQLSIAKSWPAFAFACSATLLLAPLLFRPTFSAGADIAFHIYNAQRYVNEARDGVFYPRWVGDWFGGYGAPVGVAYAPLPYLSVALLAFFGIPTLAALKLIVWLSLWVSGLAMYRLAARFLSPAGAIGAGLLYQLAPYRVIDLFDRTALPEYLAFAWLPLIVFLTIVCVREQRRIHHIALSLAIAGLLLTHLLIAYLFAIAMVVVIVYLYWCTDDRRLTRALRLGGWAGLGLLLAAIYWLPALAENQYLNTSWFQGHSGWGDYRNNFLFAAQIYRGTALQALYTENIAIGIGALLSLALGFLGFALYMPNWRARTREKRGMALVMAVLLVLSAGMSFSFSRPLWAILPRGDIVAFPWRWLTISTLGAAYLGGAALDVLLSRQRAQSPGRAIAAYALPGLLAALLGGYFCYSGLLIWRYSARLDEQTVQQFLGEQPLPVQLFGWVYADEYLPEWSRDLDYTAAAAGARAPITSATPIKVTLSDWRSQFRAFQVQSPTAATLDVRTFWFPGWHATVDGQSADIEVQPKDGTMLLQVPAGTSRVTLAFENTPVRSAGMLISAAAALMILATSLLSLFGRLWSDRRVASLIGRT